MSINEKPMIIYPDGRTEAFEFKGDLPELEEMQKVVGGLIEPVNPRKEDWIMIVNEEGLLLELEYNDKATGLQAPSYFLHSNVIVGTAIYMPMALLGE